MRLIMAWFSVLGIGKKVVAQQDNNFTFSVTTYTDNLILKADNVIGDWLQTENVFIWIQFYVHACSFAMCYVFLIWWAMSFKYFC